ncbi:MAG: alpha/beta fold hydrolase [Rhizobiaceae bacterium]
MPYLERNGARVYFETTGDGPPLLLIAGIASDVASWTPVVPLLEEKFRLILFDNRGCGRTEHEGPINPGDWVGDAAAVLDKAGAAQANVLGHSLGGMIALRLAEAAPERIGEMAICAAAANPEPKTHALLEEMVQLYESGMDAEAWFRLLFQWLFAPPFFADSEAVEEAGRAAAAYEFCQSPADFRRQFEAAAKFERLDGSAMAKPFSHLMGEHDLMVTVQMSRDAFADFRNVREIIIPGAGHSVHWDQPEAFADAVTRVFL